MSIIYGWHRNAILETESIEIPVKLKKIWFFPLFCESLNPELANPMSIIFAWHKNTMLETECKEIPEKPKKN